MAMLKVCAPGAEVVRHGDHGYLVTFKGKSYPALPKGKHGVRPERAEIKVGKVRHMIGLLGIDERCAYAELHLPIKGKEETETTAVESEAPKTSTTS
jgi:hypothetical protein